MEGQDSGASISGSGRSRKPGNPSLGRSQCSGRSRKNARLDAGDVAYEELNLVGVRPNAARSIGSEPEHPLLVLRVREKLDPRA